MQTDEGKLEVGDVVVLMSRTGPRMTVNEVVGNGDASCVWFDESDKLHREPFQISALKKVKAA